MKIIGIFILIVYFGVMIRLLYGISQLPKDEDEGLLELIGMYIGAVLWPITLVGWCIYYYRTLWRIKRKWRT